MVGGHVVERARRPFRAAANIPFTPTQRANGDHLPACAAVPISLEENMQIERSGPGAPLNLLSPHHPRAPVGIAGTAASLLSAAQEHTLTTLRDPELNFEAYGRRVLTDDLVGAAGYLTQGWLPDDSYRPGPVKLLREQATSPEGVAWDAINLGLQPDVQVIGMRDTQGGADSYFVCQPDPDDAHAPPRFFTLCIESGQGSGVYEIFVSPPRDWQAFLDQLG